MPRRGLLSYDGPRKWARRPLLIKMEEGNNLKAVLYDRSSISNPFVIDTLQGRKAQLIDYAEKKGIEIVDVCVDIGFSGSTLDRPGLQTALRHIQEGTADVLLLMERDRLNKGVFLEVLQNLPVVVVREETQRGNQEVTHEL